MMRFCQSYKGAISVFLTLILLPTFVLAGVIIDGSRIYASRNIVSGAGDLAMNAALADYDSKLKDMYSLFAMANDQVPDATVKKYFNESINGDNLGSDGYNRLPVYLTLEDGAFNVYRIEGTEAYRTEVMLQQVLEYSKYRIPIAMINDGILDGLDSFNGMDKKVNAVKSQLKFEEELTDLQQVLEDLWEQLEMQDALYEYFMKEYPKVIPDAQRNYALISRLLIASNVLHGDVGSESGSCRDLMEQFVSEGESLATGGNSNYDIANTAAGNFETIYKLKRLKNGISDPNDIFEGLEENTDEWREAEQTLENYFEKAETLAACESTLHSCITPLVQETDQKLNKAYKNAESGIECTKKIIELSEKVIEKNLAGSSLKNAHKDFGDKLQQVDDEQMRTPMEQEYNDYDRLLDNNKVQKLIQQTQNNKTFYEDTKIGTEGITYCSMQITIAEYTSDSFYGNAGGYAGGITNNSSLSQAGKSFYQTEFRGSDFPITVTIADLSAEDFYQFVKEKCCIGTVDKNAKKQAIKEVNEKLSKGKDAKELIENDDVSSSSIDLSDVPTVWLSQIGSTGSEVDIEVGGSADSNSSRKKASKSVRNSLDEVTEQTKGLTDISSSIVGGSITRGAMNIVEAFLVSGYESKMFSYYTVDKDENGNAEKKNSLTGYEFSADNNVMYKSEMEYMLFGKNVPSQNVRNAKGSIFSIRFGLNAIGAFSSAPLRTEADGLAIAITGGLGSFALPLVRSVVILGVTYTETYQDMQDLLAGKAVMVLKHGTWHLTGYTGNEGFKLDYHQYLSLFLIVKNMFGSGMSQSLARTADCIELNIRNKGSTMKNKQTMLAIDATVELETMFMRNISIEINAQGGSVRNVNDNDYEVRYHGILGY